MNVIAVITARMASKRLPGKALMDISGHPMLWHVIERVKACKTVDHIKIATTSQLENEVISDAAVDWDVCILASSRRPHDVLKRITDACRQSSPDIVVRICGDAPLFCTKAVDALVKEMITTNVGGDKTDYMKYGSPCIHAGFDVALFKAVKKMDEVLAPDDPRREHGFGYMPEVKTRCHECGQDSGENIFYGLHFRGPAYRLFPKLTVDTQEDLDRVRKVYAKLYKEGEIIDFDDVVKMVVPEEEIA